MPTSEALVTTRTQIAGVSVPELARRFGTPTYVYDAAKIVERVNDLKQFDVIRYAQKACSSLAILDLVRRQGVVVDAVSAGEVHRAIKAGYSQGSGVRSGHAEIVYTADIFDRESLETVVKLGIPVNCGSPVMIDQLGERCRGETFCCGSIRALATGIAKRRIRAASNRSMGSGMSNWMIACGGPIGTG